jgi:hypothetical protein
LAAAWPRASSTSAMVDVFPHEGFTVGSMTFSPVFDDVLYLGLDLFGIMP